MKGRILYFGTVRNEVDGMEDSRRYSRGTTRERRKKGTGYSRGILPREKSIVSRRNARSSEPIWNAIVKGDCTLHIGV